MYFTCQISEVFQLLMRLVFSIQSAGHQNEVVND
uniref:Uncharacterized protein n=1 Tax=Anguilla anguilla TaxID=7936 RepID=A0A0E9Q2B7_ANGAN